MEILKVLRVYSLTELRAIDPRLARGFEVILWPSKKRYLFNPLSTAADDGDTVIAPSAVFAGCCEGGRWELEGFTETSGGGGGGGSDDDTDVDSSSGLIFLQRQNIAVAVQDVTFSGLNGDLDDTYVIHVYVPVAPNGLFQLEPNGDSANADYGAYVADAGGSVFGGGANGYIGEASGGDAIFITLQFRAKTSPQRLGHSQATSCVNTSTPVTQIYSISWKNSIDNVTSLTIHGTAAGMFAIGSEITLWKMPGT